ncbi:hypothetical protein F2P81_010463 [Scophthalmus maximus]|uniref:Uncharacterized protein n=1 Tax=Scophthalmus maximus TaxID=52904 RepID=A0A6A4SXW5_SCOMX|nr:hypothetical protein F2P81_010463 [Scophthalmus maximus]
MHNADVDAKSVKKKINFWSALLSAARRRKEKESITTASRKVVASDMPVIRDQGVSVRHINEKEKMDMAQKISQCDKHNYRNALNSGGQSAQWSLEVRDVTGGHK